MGRDSYGESERVQRFVGAACLATALNVAGCAGAADPPRAGVTPNSQAPVCDATADEALRAARTALRQGRALVARRSVEGLGPQSARSVACTQQLRALRAETLSALGDCTAATREGHTGACEPAASASARQSVERASVLRATGKHAEANLVLARAFYAEAQRGSKLTAVPAWLVGAGEVMFTAPAQFVIRHEAGISVLGPGAGEGGQAPELQELRRCDVKGPLHWVSAGGHYASVGEGEPRLLDLSHCSEVPGPVPTAFSRDDRSFLRMTDASLQRFLQGSNTASWSLPLAPEAHHVACLSPDGALALLAQSQGAPVLYRATDAHPLRTLSARYEIELPPEVRKLGAFPFMLGLGAAATGPRKCEFSADGERVALTSGTLPAVTEIWNTQTGELKLGIVGDLDKTSSGLTRAIQSKFPGGAEADVVLHAPLAKGEHSLAVPADKTLGAFRNSRHLFATTQTVKPASAAEWCVWNFDTGQPFPCVWLAPDAQLTFGQDGAAFAVRDAAALQVFTQEGKLGRRFAVPAGYGELFDRKWASVSRKDVASSLWNVSSGQRLRVLADEPPPLLEFEHEYLCLSRGCLLGKDYTFAFARGSVNFSKDPPEYAPADPADAQSAIDSLRLTAAKAFDRKQQFPAISLNQAGSQLWALTPDYRLHVLSPAGQLLHTTDIKARFGGQKSATEEASVGGECGSWRNYPRTLQAPHGNRWIVMAATDAGCTWLVDLDRKGLTRLPFVHGELLALSGDGQRLALYADDTLQVLSLPAGHELGRIPLRSSVAVGLSFTGDSLVVIENTQLDELAQAQYRVRLFKSNGNELPVAPALAEAFNGERPARKKASAPGSAVQGLRELWGTRWAFGARLLAIGDQLFDYRGRYLASVRRQGQRVVVNYADGSVEQFGQGAGPGYRCQVGDEILPAEFCADALERPGTLQGLLGPRVPGAELPWHRKALQEASNAPRAADTCRYPVAACGGDHDLHTTELSCNAEDFDASVLQCLPRVHSLKIEGLTSLPALGTFARILALVLPQARLANFRELGQLKQLQALSLSHSNLESLAELGPMPELNSLYVAGTRVSELDVARYPKLTVLDISDTKIASLRPLLGLPELVQLTITRGQFPQTELDELRKSETGRFCTIIEIDPKKR